MSINCEKKTGGEIQFSVFVFLLRMLPLLFFFFANGCNVQTCFFAVIFYIHVVRYEQTVWQFCFHKPWQRLCELCEWPRSTIIRALQGEKNNNAAEREPAREREWERERGRQKERAPLSIMTHMLMLHNQSGAQVKWQHQVRPGWCTQDV